MSITIADRKSNLSAQLHGGSLNKVRNVEMLFQRTANTVLSNIDPIDTVRTVALAQAIHDDVYNYALPTDFNKLVDLIPQDNRNADDVVGRRYASSFDLNKMLKNKQISIEANEGTKYARINWKSRASKVIHNMNSVTANGTWTSVGTATGISASTVFKVSGSASIEFNIVTTGDGIANTTMTAVNLTDEDEVADFFVYAYFGTVPTSVSARWGNDLTTNYWSSTAQTTQADGTALRAGWNLIKFSWGTATETGTVVPSTIDSFRITVASTAQANVRIDNITCSIGRNFDCKYYSKYIVKNSSGIWIPRATSDDDIVVLDDDAIQILLLEDLKAGAQQSEGSDSTFDINWANKELETLYKNYRAEHPSQAKKIITSYGSLPRFRN